jgi:hypothetical protein
MPSDFFICYASPDRDAANELCWALQARKRTVFLDSIGIAPGEAWDTKLAAELEQAAVIVVLVSPNSARAHYQRAEIAEAIRSSRHTPGTRHVIPVMLRGAEPRDQPYGLVVVQGMDASQPGGFERIAKRLDEQFPGAQGNFQSRRRDLVLGAALRLDRVKQWNHILEASLVAENTLFLFHGLRNQNVGLFQERIQRFFAQEVNAPHAVYRVPFNIQGQTPRTGTDWLAHWRDALQCGGPLATELVRLVQQHPLFVMLGELPLPLDRLSDEHLAALGEFISGHLPATLGEARIDRWLTILMVFDYRERPADRLARLQAWGAKAELTGRLRFRPLPEASLPTWEEVKDYLETQLRPPASPGLIIDIQQEYVRLAANPSLTFDELARLVDSFTLTG